MILKFLIDEIDGLEDSTQYPEEGIYEKIGLSQSQFYQAARSLVKLGLLKSSVEPDDKGNLMLEITARGIITYRNNSPENEW